MNDAQQREAAKKFAQKWSSEKGYEKGQTQKFWNELLRDVYGVERPEDYVDYEVQVKGEKTTSFIDGLIDYTHVMIEQKGSDVDLRKKYRQSDGSMRTPYQQTKKYSANIDYDRRPRWIIVCNFREFHVHDQKQPSDEPKYIIQLSELEKDYNLMDFLVNLKTPQQARQEHISKAAGELVAQLKNALEAQYKKHTPEGYKRDLNILCVRLVFCLYADDAKIFGKSGMFRDYLSSYNVRDMRRALEDLFEVLDMTQAERDAKYPYMADENPELYDFPYVNGGLFSKKDVEIPAFTEEIRDLLLNRVSAGWYWHEINPTIFGALFESALDSDSRRQGGMHYTSIENIHKVIDPLFLDDLRAECDAIIAMPNDKKGVNPAKGEKVREFKEKLSKLTFFDPACGSGNFLTETYLSLRGLENALIEDLFHGQLEIGEIEIYTKIEVHISQFYGIEINDFAVSVAKTALWIAESQMMQETERIIKMHLNFLPLETNANIHEGNALKMDWAQIIEPEKLNYIISNPPFVGCYFQSKEQKNDILSIYVDEKGKRYNTAGKIDYVAGWYFKAAEFLQGTSARAAFVSTNSITQGEQVASVWEPLFKRFKIHIDFAHRTFRWDNQATDKAHVHCVIVGFSVAPYNKQKVIYDDRTATKAKNINAYLTNADDVFIKPRRKPLYDVPILQIGGKPAEGGFLILSEEEKDRLLKKEPQAAPLIRPFMMGADFIKRRPRYCLWLVNADPGLLDRCPEVLERIEKVRKFRLESKKAATRKKAATSTLFDEVHECYSDYVAIPLVSSENRQYIPIDYLPASIIPGNKLFTMQKSTLYHFGVLISSVHMAWMRAVCGRLKSDYSYSNTIVYNNFPWPDPSSEQRAKIEEAAWRILEAREKFPATSFSSLYKDLIMPPELQRAHEENDRAVIAAYGFKSRKLNEARIVAKLMKLYAEKTKSEKGDDKNAAKK